VVKALLKLLVRLVILAVTGEWVDLDKYAKKQAPVARPEPSARVASERAVLMQRFEALRARQPESGRASRDHLGRFAADFGAPLEQHLRDQGVGLRARSFVPLVATPDEEPFLRELRARTRFWSWRLTTNGPDASLASYVTAARERARALAEDAPGLLERLRRTHDWPVFLPLPSLSQRPDLLRGAFGVWLDALAGEVLLTLQLGPGYTRFLLRTAGTASTSRASGTPLLDEAPAPLLRVFASLGVLAFLGHFEAAEHIAQELTKQVGEEPELSIAAGARPASGPIRLPYAVWQPELERLLGSMLEDVQPALGGEGLLDAPEVAFLHGENARALRLSEALVSARPLATEARHGGAASDWLAAALMVLERGGVPEPELVRRLRRALGEVYPGAVEQVAPGAAETSHRLDQGMRDPRVIRDAVLLGAILAPRSGRHRKLL